MKKLSTLLLKTITVCSITSSIFAQKTLLTAIVNAQNPTCNYDSNGSIEIIPDGGTPPYSYSWADGSTSSTIQNIPEGNYSVTLTDATLNTLTFGIIITSPPAISILANVEHVTSYGGNDGTVDVNVSNPSLIDQISWTSSNGQNLPSNLNQNGLEAGNFTINVVDINGCTASESFTIEQPAFSPVLVFNPNQSLTNNNGSNSSSNYIINQSGNTVLLRSGTDTHLVEVYDHKNNKLKDLNIIPENSEFQQIQLDPGLYTIIFYAKDGGKEVKILSMR